MKILLCGAGMQARAIAWDLLHRCDDLEMLTIVERDAKTVNDTTDWLFDQRVKPVWADVTDASEMAPLMADADVAISAVNYWFNADLTRLAIEGGAHFVDLGGNNDIVQAQFDQHAAAEAAGVTIIPDCGLAPGLAGLLGYHLAGGFDECESVRLRVGGLPANPKPPLDYMIVFAVQGLINEYIEDCLVIRDGRVVSVPGMSELESLSFPEPYGEMEAFQTSGGCSTLPKTLLGKVRDLDYKTIRYPGHCEKIRLLMDLGLTSSEPIVGAELRPRDVLGNCLEAACPADGPDVVLLRVEASGTAGGARSQRTIEIIDRQAPDTGLTAMTRMTGFPTAIIAAMLAHGEVDRRGVHPQELVIDGEAMISALLERGIAVERAQTAL